LELPQKPKTTLSATILIVTIAIVSLFAGGLLGYSIGYSTISGKIDNLQDQLSTLQEQMSNLQPTQNVTYQNVTQNITYSSSSSSTQPYPHLNVLNDKESLIAIPLPTWIVVGLERGKTTEASRWKRSS